MIRTSTSSMANALPGLCLVFAGLLGHVCPCVSSPYQPPDKQQMLEAYYQAMTAPKPLTVRRGVDFTAHRNRLRTMLLASMGLWPLPERIALDSRQGAILEHPWCRIQSISYRLWPGVRVCGLLYTPKHLFEEPAPAMLCPHGHWQDFFAHPSVQKRCLMFAKLGYVVFCPPQLHYEDLMLGISHQTLNVWGNMRALDYLQGLPQVDQTRLGVCGCSGGGLQTQMLVALDDRVKAATIAGFTCNYKHIMALRGIHCRCNHFPNVMRYTDHPEISTLGLPTPVQYLTMNDWTKDFAQESFPLITRLYAAHGAGDALDCHYEATEHNYDQSKRERTYGWMEKHLRPASDPGAIIEPAEIKTFTPDVLLSLCSELSQSQSFPQLSEMYRKRRGYEVPTITSRQEWTQYCRHMTTALEDLLGTRISLAQQSAASRPTAREIKSGLIVERINCPTEGPIAVPVIVLRSQKPGKEASIKLLYDRRGPEELLTDSGPGSPQALARQGAIVVLPDTRFIQAFEPGTDAQKNAIVWGRPFPGMACTDLCAILDGICSWPELKGKEVTIITRNAAAHAVAALFTAILDKRIAALDLDFQGKCFTNRDLPLVPFVLQHGDVLQWAALLADRDLTLRQLPKAVGDATWLVRLFELLQNDAGLTIKKLEVRS